jgi:hypothetical protein
LHFFLQGKVYMFDKVLKPNVSQENVYNAAAKHIVKGMKKSIFLPFTMMGFGIFFVTEKVFTKICELTNFAIFVIC